MPTHPPCTLFFTRLIPAALIALTAAPTSAQEAAGPSLEEVRKRMAIPSKGETRGQRDGIGFASKKAQMDRVWKLSAAPFPMVELGKAPGAPIIGAICPHDDYLYAGPVYRRVIPAIKAKTVILVGVFHSYRRFNVSNKLVFGPYKRWRSPTGAIKISPLRDQVLARLPGADTLQEARMVDREHSIEAIAYWLHHQNPELELLPVQIPALDHPRLEDLSTKLARAVSAVLEQRNLSLGEDVAVVISADAIHYGPAFRHTPFGEGGVQAYSKAVQRDQGLMRRLSGNQNAAKNKALYETFVDPAKPQSYRVTWCGRFSITFGLRFLEKLNRLRGGGGLRGHPIAYSTSIGHPELKLGDAGPGVTAPSHLYHFVGYPGLVYTATKKRSKGKKRLY